MKKILSVFIAIVIISIVSCQRNEKETAEPQDGILKEKRNPEAVPQGAPLPQSEIDKIINNMMDTKKDFRWEWVDLKTLWSATHYGDQSVALGYKPLGYDDISPMINKINVKQGKWKQVHDAIINLVLEEYNKHSAQPVKIEDIMVEDDAVLPIITLRITDRNVITKLFNLENVRYIEPLDYWPADDRYRATAASGCSASTTPINGADWTTIPPGCRLPWNYNNLNIPAAWNTSQGEGIKIGIIDGGISATQTLLGAQFNNGYSNNSRTVTTDYTYGTSAYTTCTHGNSMSGLAVAPRNDQNAITGVAYKASLHFIHGCEDVVLDKASEKTGLKNALIRMGDDIDVKIVSMSIGAPFASGVIKDGVTYANNKGKMLFAAAGTSSGWTSWWGVVYPAAYSECNAITGVKENGNTCSSCHDGSQVDFTIPMERNASSNRNSLSLPLTGTLPTYIGGSSAATSTAAGIAALVWSAKPALTRAQVLDCLRLTAQYAAPTSNHGYGNLNASAAVALALTY